jgi:hypothetical protein
VSKFDHTEQYVEPKHIMSDLDIVSYAETVAIRLGDDSISLVELVSFLKDCQKRGKKSLKEGIEGILIDKDQFFACFANWKKKEASKVSIGEEPKGS